MEFVLSILGDLHRKLIQHTQPVQRKRAVNHHTNEPPAAGVSLNPTVDSEPGPSSSRVSLELMERRVSSSISKESSVALPSEESVETAPLSTVESDESCRSFPLVLSSTRGLRLLAEPQSTTSIERVTPSSAEQLSMCSRSSGTSRTLRRANLHQFLRLMNGFGVQEPHMSPRSKRRRSLTRLTGEDLPPDSVVCADSLRNPPKSMVCSPAFINKLCDQAQQVANAIAHTNDLYYRKLRDIGQNLYVESSYTQENFDVNGETVCKRWYSEQKYYDYYHHKELLHTQASRFTQMVWKSSQKLGIGKATIGANKVIVVALYKPAGNVAGEFHNNVFSVPIRRTASSLGSTGTSAVQSDEESSINSVF